MRAAWFRYGYNNTCRLTSHRFTFTYHLKFIGYMSTQSRTVASIGLTALLVAALTVGLAVAAQPAGAQDVEPWDQDSTVTVNENGEVESMTVEYTMSQQAYDSWSEFFVAENPNADNLAEGLAIAMEENNEDISDVTGTETQTNNGYVINLEVGTVDTSKSDSFNITTSGSLVTMKSTDTQNPAESDTVRNSTLRVEMPGQITDHNADEVQGNTAIWYQHDGYTETLEATADTSVSAGGNGGDGGDEAASDGDDGGDGDDSDGGVGPGFGAVGALVAVALISAAYAVRRQ